MSFCHSLHLDLSWVLYELFQKPFPLKQLNLLKSILIIHKVSTSSKSHLQTLIKPFFHQMGWKLNSRFILMNDNFYDVLQLLKKLLAFCLFFTNTCILIRLILTKNQLKIFWSHSAKFNQTLKGWSSQVPLSKLYPTTDFHPGIFISFKFSLGHHVCLTDTSNTPVKNHCLR